MSPYIPQHLHAWASSAWSEQDRLVERRLLAWPMTMLEDSLRWHETAKVTEWDSMASGKDRSCCHFGWLRCLRSEGVRAVTTPASVAKKTAAYASTAPKGPPLFPGKLRLLASITCIAAAGMRANIHASLLSCKNWEVS